MQVRWGEEPQEGGSQGHLVVTPPLLEPHLPNHALQFPHPCHPSPTAPQGGKGGTGRVGELAPKTKQRYEGTWKPCRILKSLCMQINEKDP